MISEQIEQILATKMSLESQMITLEGMNINREVLETQKKAAQAMQQNIKAMGGAEAVDDVMDSIDDQMNDANDISEALSRTMNMPGVDLDDDDLLAELDAVPGIERIRYTSPHPLFFDDALIRAHRDLESLCPHVHLPVQSGSDRVLEAMRRHYTIDHYRDRVARLRERAPDIALSTDIIVGFPGETEEEFEETMALLREVRYDSIFAFKYSPRPGTKASEMEDTVPEADKTRRLDQVLKLQNQITAEKMQTYTGKTLEVLVEGPSRSVDKGQSHEWQMMGRTRTNVIVNFRVPMGDFWNNRLKGELIKVGIDEAKAHSLYGQVVA